MDVDQQIQELIANAPKDGKTPVLVRAIAPALKNMAGQLSHSQYYVVKTDDDGWLITPLQNRSDPSLEKKVVYAYPTMVDARASFHHSEHPKVLAVLIPVTHILFQMLAMKTVNSTVFFESPGNITPAIEVTQSHLLTTIKDVYRESQTLSQKPSDIA
ncbi:MAG: hypothetical protein AAGA75_10570 [Cyanobacteria bacterium P01_E01_bin.6]